MRERYSSYQLKCFIHCLHAESENTRELTVYEQAPIYETITDPTIGDNMNSYNDMNNELPDAISTVPHPQSLVIDKSDESIQKQEQPHMQLDIVSCTNSSSTILRQLDIPRRSSVDTSQCLHADSYHYEEISQYEKIPSSDVNQIKASKHLEQNTHSHDLQVGHYEMINHYEKAPHCDLSQITSAQRMLIIYDERYQNKETGKDGKTLCSDAKQIETASEDLEQNTRSHDLQVDKRGHYDQICQYESISHYEKVPHCDLALISSTQRKPVHDEKLPPST